MKEKHFCICILSADGDISGGGIFEELDDAVRAARQLAAALKCAGFSAEVVVLNLRNEEAELVINTERGVEEPPDDIDEELLDRIWDRIGAEEPAQPPPPAPPPTDPK